MAQVDMGKYSLEQTQHTFLGESSVREGLRWCGRGSSFLPCSSADFRPSVFHVETAFAVLHKALLLEPSTPLAGSPADYRSFRL